MWDRRHGGRTGAALAFVVGTLGGLALALAAGAAAVAQLSLPYQATQLHALSGIERTLPLLERSSALAPGEDALWIVYIGDSTALAADSTTPFVPQALASALHARTPRGLRVRRLVQQGMGAYSYLMLAARIADVEPDLAVFAINPIDFSEIARTRFSRPALAGLARARQLPELALLPIGWAGLTYDQVLKNSAVFSLGGLPAWRWLSDLQVDWTLVRGPLETAVHGGPGPEQLQRYARATGLAQAAGGDGPLARVRSEKLYGAALAGVGASHPVVRALEAVARELAAHDVACLFYLTPIDLARLERRGLETAGFTRTVDALRSTLGAAGAHFVDLSDALGDGDFRDDVGHMTPHGATTLAERLADEAHARLSLAPLRPEASAR